MNKYLFENDLWQIKQRGNNFYFYFLGKKWYGKFSDLFLVYLCSIVCGVFMIKLLYDAVMKNNLNMIIIVLIIFIPIIYSFFSFSKATFFDLLLNFDKRVIAYDIFNKYTFGDIKFDIMQDKDEYHLILICNDLSNHREGVCIKVWSSSSCQEVRGIKHYFEAKLKVSDTETK